MKRHLIAISILITTLPCLAEYRTWTNAQGQTAELDLYEVTTIDNEKAGRFRMKNGKTVVLKVSQLSADDGKLLAEWEPSVFEEVFDDNLVILKDGKFQEYRDHKVPAKYYVFYHTASWCPPCRAFTPTLVDWYNNNKNGNFELVLITHDQEKSAMLAYAKEKKMPWPQLEVTKTKEFDKAHPQGVSGIPALIVCDLKGKVLGNYRSQLDELTKLVK